MKLKLAKSSNSELVKEEKKEVFDNRVLTSDEYRSLWAQMTVKFSESEPIMAMCCAKAQEFKVENDTLVIGFEYGTNMLVVDNDQNKEIMLGELFKNKLAIPTKFYVKEKPIDEVKVKIDRLKKVFDKNILKISKK